MKLLQLLIIKLLLLVTSWQAITVTAAKGNVNDERKHLSIKRENINNPNTRDKRALDLGLIIRQVFQNSAAAPAVRNTARPPTTIAPPPPNPLPPNPQPPGPVARDLPPLFGFRPNNNYPFGPNSKFNIPGGFLPVSPPPLQPSASAAPPQPRLTQIQQQKQALLGFLAALSGVPPPAPATSPAPPAPPANPPQNLVIPTDLLPSYQQQLRDRLVYKYGQKGDTSYDGHEYNIAPQYPYVIHGSGPGPHDENYYYESPIDSSYNHHPPHITYEEIYHYPPDEIHVPASADGSYSYEVPIGSSFHHQTHNTNNKEEVLSASPDNFRISYPDEIKHYQPESEIQSKSSEIQEISPEKDKETLDSKTLQDKYDNYEFTDF